MRQTPFQEAYRTLLDKGYDEAPLRDALRAAYVEMESDPTTQSLLEKTTRLLEERKDEQR